MDIFGDGPLPGWVVPRDDGTLAISEAVREALCADLDRERAAELHSHVVLQSAASWRSPSTAPDRAHPTTYMICEQESVNCIPVPAQEAMSANADNVVRLPSAHFAQLSIPDDLAEALGRI